MLKDDLTLFSESQVVTTTAVGSRIVDGTTAGNAKLNELFWHTMRTANLAIVNTLTMDTQPTAGDTFTIGDTTYTYTADGTASAAGEIDVGADLADAQALTVAAINGTGAAFNVANDYVTAGAFAANVSTLTIVSGVKGDEVATTETFTAGTNVFAAVSMGAGTVTFTLQTSATQSGTDLTALAGTIKDLLVSPAVSIADINASGTLAAFKARIPDGALRYIGIKYTVSVELQAGSFDSHLVFEA